MHKMHTYQITGIKIIKIQEQLKLDGKLYNIYFENGINYNK